MMSNTSARMIGFDDTGSGWGNLDLQDTSAFSAGLSGHYVFSYEGVGVTASGLAGYAAAGMFTASGGAISSGLADLNTDGSIRQGLSFTGTYSSVDPSTGRGTWTMVKSNPTETWNFVLYMLNSSSFIFYIPGANMSALGVAAKQDTSSAFSNASLSGDLVFLSTGYADSGTGDISAASAAGRFTADGNGLFPDGVNDKNVNGSVGANIPWHGAYTIYADGHGTAAMTDNNSVETTSLGLYVVSANNALWVSLSSSVVSTGQFMPQASGTYNLAALHGSFGFTLRGTLAAAGGDVVGQMTVDGAGGLSGKEDLNAAGTLSPPAGNSLTGNYTLTSSGRGEIALTVGSSTSHYAAYAISERLVIAIPIDSGADPSLGIAYRQF